LERLLRLGHRLHLLGEPGVGGDPVLLHLLQLPVDPQQGLLDRPHQVVHRLLPLLQIGRGRVLELAQLGLREREEGLVVLPQCVGREGGERLPELHLRLRQQRELLSAGPPLRGGPLVQPRDLPASGEPGDQAAGDDAQEEPEQKVSIHGRS
jgi:hypothetical protein